MTRRDLVSDDSINFAVLGRLFADHYTKIGHAVLAATIRELQKASGASMASWNHGIRRTTTPLVPEPSPTGRGESNIHLGTPPRIHTANYS